MVAQTHIHQAFLRLPHLQIGESDKEEANWHGTPLGLLFLFGWLIEILWIQICIQDFPFLTFIDVVWGPSMTWSMSFTPRIRIINALLVPGIIKFINVLLVFCPPMTFHRCTFDLYTPVFNALMLSVHQSSMHQGLKLPSTRLHRCIWRLAIRWWIGVGQEL